MERDLLLVLLLAALPLLALRWRVDPPRLGPPRAPPSDGRLK
jgi:hypothetical protein